MQIQLLNTTVDKFEFDRVQIDEDNEGSNKIFKGQGFTARKNLMADDNNKFNVLTYFV